MTISHAGSGAAAVGTTSLACPYPGSISANNMLFLAVASKYVGPDAAPTGFTLIGQVNGGAGSSGADTGSVYSTVYYKIADGTETGNVDVTLTGGDCAVGRISRITKAATEQWVTPSFVTGTQTTGTTSWSFTASGDPGLIGGDHTFAVTAVNTNLYTYSVAAILCDGANMGAQGTGQLQRYHNTTTNGDNCGLILSEHVTDSGTSTGSPLTFTMTASGTATDNPAGSVVFVRLRDLLVTLTCTTISFAQTGQAATLTINRHLACDTASFVLTGQDAALSAEAPCVAALSGTGTCAGTLSCVIASGISGNTGTVAGTLLGAGVLAGALSGTCTIGAAGSAAIFISAALTGTGTCSAIPSGGAIASARHASTIAGSCGQRSVVIGAT